MLKQYSREKVIHSEVRDTLILRTRQFTIRVVVRCTVCKKFKTKAGSQVTALLPRARITESPPFIVTGVDFAVPLYAKAMVQ